MVCLLLLPARGEHYVEVVHQRQIAEILPFDTHILSAISPIVAATMLGNPAIMRQRRACMGEVAARVEYFAAGSQIVRVVVV